jgi:peptidoglycan/xylan/chitin deacetylase (PgdA/CDA1 family)
MLQFITKGDNVKIKVLVWVIIFFSTILSSSKENGREVAVTFDDLPINSKAYKDTTSRKKVCLRLIEAITTNKVPAIGFVNENKLYHGEILDQGRVEILRNWLDAGLDLGNHTYSHLNLHKTPLEDFKKDVIKGEKITKKLLIERNKRLQYFRHPYLYTGRTLKVKYNLEEFLKNRGYTIAPVSIDNSEWIFASAYEKTFLKSDSLLQQRIAEAYLVYMEKVFQFYEKQSRDLFGYEIKQILLLHSNLLNADYFVKLVQMTKKRGYRFISLEEALKDKAYLSKDTYTGPAGITWVHRYALTQGKEKAFFMGEPPVPAFVKKEAGIGSYK